ncbi:MAG: sll0787 family AIR synthase-like protein [Cyanobacteria bacterium P01_E01_bin.34]
MTNHQFPNSINHSPLNSLTNTVRNSLGIRQKQDIQQAAKYLGQTPHNIAIGDDCAAISDGTSHLLLAAEGMLPQFVTDEPWFAGWCGVMVNVSDIYAMGGRPIAVVDTIWGRSSESIDEVWGGMQSAASAYSVPIVGGHTNCHSPHDGLSVAILGRAARPLSGFSARPGDCLMVAVTLQGQQFKHYPFWNGATDANPVQLRRQLEVLPELAEAELCSAGKDISMGGILGTALMLLEASQVGATICVQDIPRPSDVALEDWVQWFPSFGFLLSLPPQNCEVVAKRFEQRGVSCATIGGVTIDRQVHLKWGDESALLWDFEREALTGFSKGSC